MVDSTGSVITSYSIHYTKLYDVQDDSAFNEAFATTVELEGVRRWLESLGREGELAAFRQTRQRVLAVATLMAATRQRLAGVYASGLPQEGMRQAKAREYERLRADYRNNFV